MAKKANTAAMTPFLFERTFDQFGSSDSKSSKPSDTTDAPATEPEAVAEPPSVSFTEEEMNTVRQERYMEGHADGFREGHAEAMDTLEGRLNELLEQLAPMVTNLGKVQQQANDRAQANMARIVQALTEKLMPVYMKKYGAEEAMAVIAECLTEMQDPGRLMVYLSEETAEMLGDRLNKAAETAGFEGQIRLQTDPELGPSDVRVDWGAGGAQRRYDSIRQDVDDFIDRAIARIEDELGVAVAAAKDTAEDTAEIAAEIAEGQDSASDTETTLSSAEPEISDPPPAPTEHDNKEPELAVPPGIDADPIEEQENGR